MRSSAGSPRTRSGSVEAARTRRCARHSRTPGNRDASLTIEWVGLTCVAAALIVAALASIHVDTPADVQTHPIRVVSGDSLWELARAYPVQGLRTEQTVDLIRHLNALRSPVIQPGQRLLVPANAQSQPAVATR